MNRKHESCHRFMILVREYQTKYGRGGADGVGRSWCKRFEGEHSSTIHFMGTFHLWGNPGTLGKHAQVASTGALECLSDVERWPGQGKLIVVADREHAFLPNFLSPTHSSFVSSVYFESSCRRFKVPLGSRRRGQVTVMYRQFMCA